MAAKQELNNEQKAAVSCADNAVVAAGAGSGKTFVLATRYARLVTEKNVPINQILCLTFTNKAAAQMYQRIYQELFRIAAEGGEKARHAQAALDDFANARIQTLDSYSSALVRQCAARYGINPDFTIDQVRCYALAGEVSLPFLISHREHPAIKRFYPEKRPTDIADSIFHPILTRYSYIERGPDLIANFKKQCDIICTEWKKISTDSARKLKELFACISEDEALLPGLREAMEPYKKGVIEFPSEKQIQGFLSALLSLPAEDRITFAETNPLRNTLCKMLRFMAVIAGFKLNRGRQKNNPVKELLKDFFRPVFGGLSSITVFCMQAGLLGSLLELLQGLQQRYLDKKRSESILDFPDIARLARTILLEQKDIRQGEKETFRAIMIDEFQDNNELQKDLLFLLAEKQNICSDGIPHASGLCPDKLFFVGDEKQSVYLFRDADVSVFKKLKNELQCVELPLSVNYRSAPELIGAFNAIFGGAEYDSGGKAAPRSQCHQAQAPYPSVFIPETAAAEQNIPLYEAAYTPLEAGRSHNGSVTVCIFDKSSANMRDDEDQNEPQEGAPLSPLENEACFIAQRIKQLLEQKTEDGKNEYKPEDIAILFRARASQHLFEKHLRLLNIPYTCESLNNLFHGGPVNDLLAVLRLAAFPADTAAYAEMLRSPFAGLSLAGLAVCMALHNKHKTAEPFTDAPLESLCESDQYKYLQGQNVYRHICEKARYANTSNLISELWYTLGYRYETLWHQQTAVYHELYDYLYHLAVLSDAENQGLAAFTDMLQAKRDSGESITDIEIPLERPGAVQLLTIHKSKGLEFPVVFLCCCDKHGKYDQCGDVYDSGYAGIAISPPGPAEETGLDNLQKNYFWEKASDEAKRKRTAELRRLLYVGMTRAEKELYITGCLDIRKYGQNRDEDAIDDVSVLLKNYVDYRIRTYKKENVVPHDSILDNDTFFGLCLPALAAHIREDGLAAAPTFFTIEEIPAYTSEEANSRKTGMRLPNNQNGLDAFITGTQKFYADAAEIPVPVIPENHFSPTGMAAPGALERNSIVMEPLHNALRGFMPDGEFSGEDAASVFCTVDAMLKRFSEAEEASGRFSAAGFGTIAHACVEALLKGTEPEIPSELSGYLTPAESDKFLKAGTELAGRFIRSPLGKIAAADKNRESEFQFRTLLLDSDKNETFISGAIDLLFEDESTVYVVDFKTDSIENPDVHRTQMACYFHAANELRAKPKHKKCTVWLYYLRTGRAIRSSLERT